MFRIRGALLVTGFAAGMATVAGAQWSGGARAFSSGAVLVGAQGFARPPITSAVAGAYLHTPFRSVLLGVQAASTFAEAQDSRASYAVGTIGYAQRRATGVQIYPYLAAGSAAVRAHPGDTRWRPAFGAGFGIDVMTGAGTRGPMLGARVGYLTRSMSDDESVAYAALAFGFGAATRKRDEPRAIAARR